MGLVTAGLQSVATAIGSFAGQVITALQFVSSQAAGSDAFKALTNGARWHIGTGANDYWSSDGTTISTPAPVSAAAFSATAAASSTAFQMPTNTFLVMNTGGGAYFRALTNGTTATFGGTQMSFPGISLAPQDTNGALTFSAGIPTIVAGAGASVTAGNCTAFTINLGGAAQTGTITLPAATTGWIVQMTDVTTNASFVLSQTGGNQTTATFACYSRTLGTLINWTANDIARCTAVAY